MLKPDPDPDPVAQFIIFYFFSALLFGGSPNTHNHIGCIDPHCDVIRVIEDAYTNARFLCDQYYLASPELIIKHHNGKCYVFSLK